MKAIHVFLLLFFFSFGLWAFQFQPITMDFKDSGPQSTQTFLCSNNSEKPVALQIKIFSRYINSQGEEILEPADEQFLVFPARMVLEADQSQNLRVQYRGPEIGTTEQAFRIFVEQVPVQFDEQKGGGLNILYRYIGSLYVVPDTLTQQLEIKSLKYLDLDSPMLEIVIKNTGSSHSIIQDIQIQLTGEEGTLLLRGSQLPDLMDINLLSQGERVCRIPWPSQFKEQILSGEVQFEGTR